MLYWQSNIRQRYILPQVRFLRSTSALYWRPTLSLCNKQSTSTYPEDWQKPIVLCTTSLESTMMLRPSSLPIIETVSSTVSLLHRSLSNVESHRRSTIKLNGRHPITYCLDYWKWLCNSLSISPHCPQHAYHSTVSVHSLDLGPRAPRRAEPVCLEAYRSFSFFLQLQRRYRLLLFGIHGLTSSSNGRFKVLQLCVLRSDDRLISTM